MLVFEKYELFKWNGEDLNRKLEHFHVGCHLIILKLIFVLQEVGDGKNKCEGMNLLDKI